MASLQLIVSKGGDTMQITIAHGVNSVTKEEENTFN